MAEIGKLTVAIEGDNSNLDKALKDSTKATSSAMNSIATSLATAATGMKLLGAIAEGINFNKAAEQAQVSFEVMTGSAEEAQRVLSELRDFAENTPLEFADIRDATQTLLAFGIESEDAVKSIKMLGDVSGGNADKLKSLALVFGQISANGKLTGGDLLQLVNVGFNPLQEISERTGQSMAELRDEMSAGNITFAMVEESFKNVTAEGGRFYGMLEQQAGTLEGKVSTMNDAISVAMGKMTEAFMEPMKLGADIVTALAEGFGALPGPVQAFTGTIVALGGAVLVATGALSAMGVAMAPIIAAAAPWVALGVAIAGVGIAIASAVGAENQRNLEESAKKFGKLSDSLGKTGIEQEKFIAATVKAELALGIMDKTMGRFGGDLGDTLAHFENIAEKTGLTKDELARVVIESGKYSAELENVARLNLSIKEQNEINARLESQRFEVQRKAYAEAADNFYRLNPQIARARDEQRLRDAEAATIAQKQVALRNALLAVDNAINRGAISAEEGYKTKIQLRQQELDLMRGQLTLGRNLTDTQVANSKEQIAAIERYNAALEALKAKEDEIAQGSVTTRQETNASKELSDEEYETQRLWLVEQINNSILENTRQAQREAFEYQQELDALRAEKDAAVKARKKQDAEEAKQLYAELTDAFVAVGGAINADLGNALAGVVSVGNDIGKLIASGGMDIGAWASLAVTGINLLKNAFGDLESDATKSLKKIKDAMDITTTAGLTGIDDQREAQMELNNSRIKDLQAEMAKGKKWWESQAAYAARMIDLQNQINALNTNNAIIEATITAEKTKQELAAEKLADEAEAVMAAEEKRLAKIAGIGTTIGSELSRGLINGFSAMDMMQAFKEMLKEMAATAIIMATGIQDKIAAIAKSIAEGGFTASTIAGAKEALTQLWNDASSQMGVISGLLDDSFGTTPTSEPVIPSTSTSTPTTSTGPMLGAGSTVVVNNYSPEALDPAKTAEYTRASMRQLSFEGAFA